MHHWFKTKTVWICDKRSGKCDPVDFRCCSLPRSWRHSRGNLRAWTTFIQLLGTPGVSQIIFSLDPSLGIVDLKIIMICTVISNIPRCQEVYSITPTSFVNGDKYYPGAPFSPIWSFAAFSWWCSFPTWSGQVSDLKHVSMQHFSEAITTLIYLLILPVNDLLSILFINIAVGFRPPLLGSPKLFSLYTFWGSLKCIKAIGTGTVQLLQIYSNFSLPIPQFQEWAKRGKPGEFRTQSALLKIGPF